MNKRILITGARAPVALELARQFAQSGHEVFVADSVNCPLSRASRFVKKAFVLPAPRTDVKAFGEQLIKIIKSQKIELLVPTCEEVFFISWHLEEIKKHCAVFCDDFSKLRDIHSKWVFLECAKDCGVSTPESILLQNSGDLDEIGLDSTNFVFKPEFSRFASHTLVSPSLEHVRKAINPHQDFRWLAQKRVFGKEFCSYSVAEKGKLRAHACYHPAYRVGLGSGIYFEPILHEKILNFVSIFVSKINFHGQIGFDFIETDQGEVFVLECNPRATSGAHLFTHDDNLPSVFFDPQAPYIEANPARARMVAPAVVIFGFAKHIGAGGFWTLLRKFMSAIDVCFSWRDPWPCLYQFVGLFEVILRSVVGRVGIKEAATADIEWNGEALA